MKLVALRRRLESAFTLIETLVVVSIIVLILALTGPSLLGTLQGSKLSAAGDTILGILSEAQQMAQAQNTPIEVRFFKYTTPMSAQEAYRAVMMLKVTTPSSASGQVSEQYVPLGDVQRISDGIIIANDEESLSPLLAGEGFPDTKGEESGGQGYAGVEEATYNAVRFMTDGSCRKVSRLSGDIASLSYPSLPESCITLCADNGQPVTEQNLPKNFYCIQVDPYTGKIRTYRPGQN